MPVPVEFMTLSQVHGYVVGMAGIYVGPDVGPYEKALIEENTFILGLTIWSRAFGVEVMKMYILNVPRIGPATECLNQAMRHARHAAEVYMAMGRNMTYCFVCTYVLGLFHGVFFII